MNDELKTGLTGCSAWYLGTAPTSKLTYSYGDLRFHTQTIVTIVIIVFQFTFIFFQLGKGA